MTSEPKGYPILLNKGDVIDVVTVTREGDVLTVTGFTGLRGTFEWRNNETRPLTIVVQYFDRPFLLRPGLVLRAANLGGGMIIRSFAGDRTTEIDVEFAETQEGGQK